MPIEYLTLLDYPRELREAGSRHRGLAGPYPSHQHSSFDQENTMEYRTTVILEERLAKAISLDEVKDEALRKVVARARGWLDPHGPFSDRYTHIDFIEGGVRWLVGASGHTSTITTRPVDRMDTVEESMLDLHHEFMRVHLYYKKDWKTSLNGALEPGPSRLPVQRGGKLRFADDYPAAFAINDHIFRLGQALKSSDARRY